MKKLFFILSLTIAFFTVEAQIPKPILVTYKNANNYKDSLTNIRKIGYDYDNNNFIIYSFTDIWDTTTQNYLHFNKSTFTNNLYGNPTEILEQRYDTSGWKQNSRTTIKYFKPNLDTLSVYETYDGVSWNISSRKRSSYLPNGKPIYIINEKFNGSKFIPTLENNYEYFSDSLIKTFSYKIYQNDTLTYSIKETTEYDTLNRVKVLIRETQNVKLLTEWKNQLKIEYSYLDNDSKEDEKLYYNWNVAQNNWNYTNKIAITYTIDEKIETLIDINQKIVSRNYYKYKANGDLLNQTLEIWSSNLNSLYKTIDTKYDYRADGGIVQMSIYKRNLNDIDTLFHINYSELYEYKSTTSILDLTTNNYLNLFPNPTNQLVNFDLGVPYEDTPINWYVFDRTGKIIKSSSANSNNNSINIQDLQNGIYNLIVQSQKGKMYHGSFVKIE